MRLARVALILAAMPLLLALRATPAAADPAFKAFVEALWPEAQAAGVARPTFDAAFAGVVPDLSLPDLVLPGQGMPQPKGQAEFVRPPQVYLDAKLLANLAAQGRQLASQHAASLALIEQRIGVDRWTVLAIWGRETAFGKHRLPHYAIRALATQAYLGRRKELFRNELIHALKMLEARVISVPGMRASWAGAMGLVQFMPSEYFPLAVDLDGDGKRDIWTSVGDALASAANQLKAKGWISGRPWGIEARVPGTSDCSLEGPDNMRPLGEWARLGFTRADGKGFSTAEAAWPAYLMMPGGGYGPAFLVTENFVALRAYNTSDLYALFVGNLADRIAGGGAFAAPWGAIGMIPASEIEETQALLKAAGAPISKLDGRIGSNTRGVIGRYQRAKGLSVDCWPTRELLSHLRGAARK